MLKNQNMVAIAELSKGPSYQGFMGKWPFMVGSQLKACHTLPVNWTEFFFVDKSAIKAVFNWRVHLETCLYCHSTRVSCFSMCASSMTGGEKDNMNPRLDLETFKCRLLLHMTCFVFLWVWLSILSYVHIFGEKISTLPEVNIICISNFCWQVADKLYMVSAWL